MHLCLNSGCEEFKGGGDTKLEQKNAFLLELVSEELNHFGLIAGLFRQIGGHSK